MVVGFWMICGAGAAVVNAIHNATGARIRDFPATPDKLLATLETLLRMNGASSLTTAAAVSSHDVSRPKVRLT